MSVVTRLLVVTLMLYHASLARRSSDEMRSNQRYVVVVCVTNLLL